MRENNVVQQIGSELKTQAIILGSFILLFWGVEIIDWILPGQPLDAFGIRPRAITGIRGIFLAPFLHGGFGHLMANTIPFLVLGWFVLLRGLTNFTAVTIIVTLVSGVGVWLIGRTGSIHIGASGLIFGYFGYLLFRGYFERSVSAIAWSVIVGFLYGGLIWGVLPQAQARHISWEAHLFGLIGGIVAAYLLSPRRETQGRMEDSIRILE